MQQAASNGAYSDAPNFHVERTRSGRLGPPSRLILISLLLGAASLATLFALVSGNTEAARGICRKDPVLVLSDGAVLHASAYIYTETANVHSIQYTVHGPRGTTLDHIYYSGGPGVDESVVFSADRGENEYEVETLVQANGRGTSVTAALRLNELAGSDEGEVGHPLSVALSR